MGTGPPEEIKGEGEAEVELGRRGTGPPEESEFEAAGKEGSEMRGREQTRSCAG